jgi:hypothetical protein
MRLRVPTLALALLPLAGGCGGDPGGTGREGAPPRAASVEVVDLAGLEQALAARRGRPVLLNFWAIW